MVVALKAHGVVRLPALCRTSYREVADDTGLTFTQLANTLYESGSRVIGTLQTALCRRLDLHQLHVCNSTSKHVYTIRYDAQGGSKSKLPSFCHSLLHQIVTDYGSGGGSQKATLVVLVVVVISSLKIPKAFLICSGEQRNFAYIFVLAFPTDLPSQIYQLLSESLSN